MVQQLQQQQQQQQQRPHQTVHAQGQQVGTGLQGGYGQGRPELAQGYGQGRPGLAQGYGQGRLSHGIGQGGVVNGVGGGAIGGTRVGINNGYQGIVTNRGTGHVAHQPASQDDDGQGGEWQCGTEETITFISSGSGLTIIISVLLFRPNWLKTLLIRIGCVQGRQPLLPQTIEPQEQGRATGSHQVVIRADRVYYNSGTDSNDEPRGRYSHPDLSENA